MSTYWRILEEMSTYLSINEGWPCVYVSRETWFPAFLSRRKWLPAYLSKRKWLPLPTYLRGCGHLFTYLENWPPIYVFGGRCPPIHTLQKDDETCNIHSSICQFTYLGGDGYLYQPIYEGMATYICILCMLSFYSSPCSLAPHRVDPRQKKQKS